MILKQLKRKYLAEGARLGYKRALREAMIKSDNIDSPEFNATVIRKKLKGYLKRKQAKAQTQFDKAIIEDAMRFINKMKDDEVLEIVSIDPESNGEGTAQGEKIKKACLQGARNFRQFSEGGMALVSNYDIAKHYCSPTEFKKFREGQREPRIGSWVEVQTSALYNAYFEVCNAFRRITFLMNR